MNIDAAALELLAQTLPQRVAATLGAADRVLEHRFTMLGAIDFVPLDPARKTLHSGYRPIDWNLDPVSGERFPTGFPHKEWNMQTMRPGAADIKLPWELARCQHWATLGQAWRLSREPKYAVEIIKQLRDFVEANPVGMGVNWVCTMDVAIRAANWAIGLQLIGDCDAISDADWRYAYGQLLAHGHFIRGNLEDKYEITSNHFLSNVAGLFYVAAVCRDIPEGRAWIEWCLGMFEREVDIQILEDGADFESAVPYHRLVIELFLGGFAIAKHLGHAMSPHYVEKLSAMVDYLVAVMRPDGLMPQLGDADDGRLHILSDYGYLKPQDARHILAPASIYLRRPEWQACAGEVAIWEAGWWGCALPSISAVAEKRWPDVAKLFPQAGHAVSRHGGNYLVATNAIVGTVGFGNHKHNDQLGFELHVDGLPLIVDPGSHVYTGNPASRNKYRGTAFHNTIAVDHEEQNEINPEWLFRMFEKSNPEHLDCASEGATFRYRGRHKGYTRFPHPVIHERAFVHDRNSGKLEITDTLEGEGVHLVSWHFHLAPGVEATQVDGGYELTSGNRRFLLRCPNELRGEIKPSFYSPSYGVESPCLAIDLESKVDLQSSRCWPFALVPAAA
ncbi:hypothetical protein BH11PSE11_BH11PSE11_02490 [soil metagenome]